MNTSDSGTLERYIRRRTQADHVLARLVAGLTDQVGAKETSREILQQPWTWHYTAQQLVERQVALRSLIDAEPKPSLILSGAGTSDYIGRSVQDFLRHSLKRPVDARPTTDIVVRPDEIFIENTPAILVSFARSGNSPESVEAMRIALEHYPHIQHLVFTCNRHGKLAQVASSYPDRVRVVILHEATHDRGLAMTSSYSSMAIAALGLGHLTQPEGMTIYLDCIEKLAQAAERIVDEYSDLLQHIAHHQFDRVFYLGNGTLEGAAIESALKIQELTIGKIIAQSQTFLAFRHGPIAAVTEESLIVYYLSAHPHRRRYEIDLIQQLRGSGKTVCVCDVCPKELYDAVDDVIEYDRHEEFALPDSHAAPLYATVGQLLGLFRSIACGLKPDNPPGVSGSYSRVVQGVTIHKYNRD